MIITILLFIIACALWPPLLPIAGGCLVLFVVYLIAAWLIRSISTMFRGY